MKTASRIISELLENARSTEYIGEPVTQLEHALQSAALAAQTNDQELILAALLHDVGHLCFQDVPQMGSVGVLNHEALGSEFLTSLGFSGRVTSLVRGHVAAKRYLVTTNQHYKAKMSEASLKTLDYQGGEMTLEELEKFESHPEKADVLRLRAWDEAAKQPADRVSVAGLRSYLPMIDEHVEAQSLTQAQCQQFLRQGYLHIRGAISETHQDSLSAYVSALQDLPETPGKWMKYFEPGPGDKRLLCRVENFLQYHEPLNALVNGPWLTGLVSQLMQQEAVLFKEKINFKLPGAAGFAPHQDAPAFTSFGHDYHITVMLSFDDSTSENGCLQVATGTWQNQNLKLNDDLTISDDVAESLAWHDIPTSSGDIVMFGSYLPHRSGPNNSATARRALYATYNYAAEGNVRSEYFSQKRLVFPPDIERDPNREYGDSGVFNVGNPVVVR